MKVDCDKVWICTPSPKETTKIIQQRFITNRSTKAIKWDKKKHAKEGRKKETNEQRTGTKIETIVILCSQVCCSGKICFKLKGAYKVHVNKT